MFNVDFSGPLCWLEPVLSFHDAPLIGVPVDLLGFAAGFLFRRRLLRCRLFGGRLLFGR